MVKEGFKQTEIGLIPEDWDCVKLGEISEKVMVGIASAATHAYTDKGVVMFRNQNIKPNYLDTDDLLFINEDYEYTYRNKRLKGNDLLTARTGYPGTTSIVPKKFEGAQSFTTLITRLLEVNNVSFISQYMNSSVGKRFFETNQIGGGQKNVNSSILKKMPIPLPPLPEQKAIAEALSDADAWIENLELCIAKKRLIKQGTMQDLLKPKEDWEVKKLGEVAKVVGGGTPSTFTTEFWNGEIEWFTPTEVGYSKYLKSSKRKITKAGLANSSATILPVGTLLLTSRAGIGDIGILTIEASTNQGFQSLIVSKENNNEFIYYLMLTKTNELLQNASGSTFLEISPNKVKAIELCIPSLDEQTRISSILSDMDNELESLEHKLKKARQIKQGMMQELLTGRVRLV